MLRHSKRPDWGSQSFRSPSDVTYETRFQEGTEIRGFIQIEKFLRHITPQNKLYRFSGKKFLGSGAL